MQAYTRIARFIRRRRRRRPRPQGIREATFRQNGSGESNYEVLRLRQPMFSEIERYLQKRDSLDCINFDFWLKEGF